MSQPQPDVAAAPSYLVGRVAVATEDGPAALLLDGAWCGHGEPRYLVYDVPAPIAGWQIEVPLGPGADGDDGEDAPIVRLLGEGDDVVVAYDSRRHPASVFAGTDASAKTEPLRCRCGQDRFRAAVGFEIPFDADGHDDTTWFALAVQCVQCGERDVAYEDETA